MAQKHFNNEKKEKEEKEGKKNKIFPNWSLEHFINKKNMSKI